MEIYLVGGAVRDALLNLPVNEKDYVVVGSTVEEMLSQGFQAVGKAFPVFLHPETKEEYALARTEKKVAKGYHGFSFYAQPDVTLEDDLQRRDLTINAIAQAKDGKLIDPYHGQEDLKNRILRHVSPAFSEDPVRILRIARFKARFHHLEFHIAEETMQLMRKMVKAGEVDALVPERVFKELNSALCEQDPAEFFEALRECGALAVLFPDIDKLWGVPQDKKHHPEIDCGVHTMMVLQAASKLSTDPKVRFAALLHDLGKAQTPKAILPKHTGHEESSVELVKKLCADYKAPTEYKELAVLVAGLHGKCHRVMNMNADELLDLLQSLDAFRRPQRLSDFLLACQADSRGRTGHEDSAYPQTTFLQSALKAANSIDEAAIAKQHQGEAIKHAIYAARLAALKNFLK
jgi:tRNA nucleotidyltransferase (CCA-adding enzyme)